MRPCWRGSGTALADGAPLPRGAARLPEAGRPARGRDRRAVRRSRGRGRRRRRARPPTPARRSVRRSRSTERHASSSHPISRPRFALRASRSSRITGWRRLSSTPWTARSRRAPSPALTRGRSRFDGGPGQGRRAITLVPDLHVCVVTRDQVVETVPELFERLEPSARAAGLSSSSPARRRPPTSASSASRASTAREGSSSCWRAGRGRTLVVPRGVAQPGRAPGLGPGGSSVRIRPPRLSRRRGPRSRSGLPRRPPSSRDRTLARRRTSLGATVRPVRSPSSLCVVAHCSALSAPAAPRRRPPRSAAR